MTHEEADLILKQSSSGLDKFYMNQGIDSLTKQNFYLAVIKENQMLLLYTCTPSKIFQEVVYFDEIINIQFDGIRATSESISITYKRDEVIKEFIFSKVGFFSNSKFEKFYLTLLSYFSEPKHKNLDGTFDLRPVEMMALYHTKKYHIFHIRMSYGIDAFATKNNGHLIFDKENKKLIFFITHFFINDSVAQEVGAVLSISKITKVEFGDRNSPLSQKGTEPKSLNILITYNSNGVEKEILFSHVGLNSYLFEDLYKELHSLVSEPIKLNDKGVIEL